MSQKQNVLDKFRMAIWLVLGLSLYYASTLIGTEHPQWQTVTYKMGHVTTLAWVGYWIARQALGRVNYNSPQYAITARALLIGSVIIAGSLGL